MQSIIASLASRLRCPPRSCWRSSPPFSACSRWYRRCWSTSQDLGLEAVAYVRGERHCPPADHRPAGAARTVAATIFSDNAWKRPGSADKVRRYKPCEHNLLWGDVGSDAEGNLRAVGARSLLEAGPGLLPAEPHRRARAVHRRISRSGDRAFHLRRVEAVERNGIAGPGGARPGWRRPWSRPCCASSWRGRRPKDQVPLPQAIRRPPQRWSPIRPAQGGHPQRDRELRERVEVRILQPVSSPVSQDSPTRALDPHRHRRPPRSSPGDP